MLQISINGQTFVANGVVSLDLEATSDDWDAPSHNLSNSEIIDDSEDWGFVTGVVNSSDDWGLVI